MRKRVALITGITGQDGSYLAEFLLAKNYRVFGIKRRSSSFNTSRIDHFYESPTIVKRNFELIYGDLSDFGSLFNIIKRVRPNEIYNLAAQSHVAVSFENPIYTTDINATGTLRLLECIRQLGLDTKFYQASTSELFGKNNMEPQNEKTPFYPKSPYAVSKLFAYWITVNYRESYNLFACNGILFNHESPRRGETFVTKKITQQLSRVYYGLEKILLIGNLDAKRDWGHAKDYVEMQWLMLQQKKPEDFVISTGNYCSVREFIEKVCKYLGIEIYWLKRKNIEYGLIKSLMSKIPNKKLKVGYTIVKTDKRYLRPSEVPFLRGDSTKSFRELKWKPKFDIDKLITEMVDYDLRESKKIKLIKDNI